MGGDGIFDLIVEAPAGLLGERDVHLVGIADRRPLHVLGERGLGGVALGVAAGEHLLEDPEAVVAHQRATAGRPAQFADVRLELLEVVGVVGDVLARSGRRDGRRTW